VSNNNNNNRDNIATLSTASPLPPPPLKTKEVFEVQFDDLLFSVNETPLQSRVILPGISGVIPGGRTTAVMGPTACGKSSLLKLLRNGVPMHNNNNNDNNNNSNRSNPVNISGTITYRLQRATPVLLDNNNNNSNQPMMKMKPPIIVQPSIAQRCYIGYVPQDDILDRQLTVRELLLFHAQTRLRTDSKVDTLDKNKNNNKRENDSHRSREEIVNETVDQVLSELGLQHVADSVIGGQLGTGGNPGAAANISGGQLKRVNIACELVSLTPHQPELLLLDEPTAGLDAAIAYELMLSLDTLCATRDTTICLVIQQPRVEIFQLFHQLILMNRKGGIVYAGPGSRVTSYLQSSSIGYPISEFANDADYCMDVLNGLYDSADNKRDCDSLHLLWLSTTTHTGNNNNNNHTYYTVTSSLLPLCSPLDNNNNNNVHDNDNMADDYYYTSLSSKKSESASSKAVNTSDSWKYKLRRFHFQLLQQIYRAYLIRVRQTRSLYVYIAVDFVMALALSVGFTIFLTDSYLGVLAPSIDRALQGYYPAPLQKLATTNVSTVGFSQLLFFMSSALGSAAALSAVPLIAGQYPEAIREHQAGVYIMSFALGRMIADLWFVLLHSLVFAGIW
jgi:ABC-type multidrug transport system ATPase subunit